MLCNLKLFKNYCFDVVEKCLVSRDFLFRVPIAPVKICFSRLVLNRAKITLYWKALTLNALVPWESLSSSQWLEYPTDAPMYRSSMSVGDSEFLSVHCKHRIFLKISLANTCLVVTSCLVYLLRYVWHRYTVQPNCILYGISALLF